MNDLLTVLVTGSSTGIGFATATYLAANDIHVYAGARKDEDLEKLGAFENITPVKLDVTADHNVKAVYETIKEDGNKLDVLINNAGIAIAGPLADVSNDDMKKQFEVNLLGVHRVTKQFLPMIIQNKGRIVMMSSDSGFFATPFFGPYCSSKFALEGYSDSLRREMNLIGIKVIIIRPGRITTPIWNKGKKFLKMYDDSIFKDKAQKIGKYAINKGNKEGLPPIDVAKVIYKAITVKKPKIHYLIAPSTFKYKLVKKLPASWVDSLVQKELEKL